MFAMKIAFARLLFKFVKLLVAIRRYLNNIESSTYSKQLRIRSRAERAARLSRQRVTDSAQWVADVAQEVADKKRASQSDDERAITAAAWRN